MISRPPRRWWLPLLTAVLVAALPLAVPRAAAADEAVVETRYQVAGTPEPDRKPVTLEAAVLTTAPGRAQPAIVLAHGFGGTLDDSAEVGRALARDGYTVITYSARGFGRSGGLIHLDQPGYEGADTRRIVDFAATRAEVTKNGNDPVIGFAGASYGGAAALLAAGSDARVDAIVPAYTWHSLTQSLVPQYAVSGPQRSAAAIDPSGAGVLKQRWAALFFGAGGGGGTGTEDLCGRFSAELCRAYLQTAADGRATPGLRALLDRSGMDQVLSRISAPTLLLQGEDDTLFPLDQADANYVGLPGATPKAMAWVTGGHDAGIDLNASLPLLRNWFDRHLRDDGRGAVAPLPTFTVQVPQNRLVGQNAGSRPPQTLSATTYPIDDGARPTALALTGARQRVVNPPGGVPAALTSLPGTGTALAAATRVGGYRLAVLPGQTATFATAPLAAPRTLVGSARIELSVRSSSREATLYAALWDLGPDRDGGAAGVLPQTAILPQRAVAPVRLTGLRPGAWTTVSLALPAIVHEVPVGHRIQVVIASTDQAYAGPRTPAVYEVALAGRPELTVLPLPLTAEPTPLQVPWWLVAAVALLALGAGVTSVVLAIRGRRRVRQTADAQTPLAVEGLVKAYRDGLLAVDGVSFRAERGQVVGLLGPNGAGKTTTMRMLVGLIRPDAGAVYVAGQPVHAGADVLGSVGAFIEGPGFLPHLTGRANLTAYWAATARPLSEAHLEEALRIADLGPAIDRVVRGYSQGMRQRLGIAQAMLGLPPLLLLDEPTNGLDPPQIRTMRQVLIDYAAGGRTVVVSSHLLAEVERTCSHVVVMNRGRVVLTGSVADLTRAGSLDARRLEDVFMGLVGAEAVTGD